MLLRNDKFVLLGSEIWRNFPTFTEIFLRRDPNDLRKSPKDYEKSRVDFSTPLDFSTSVFRLILNEDINKNGTL